MTDNAERLWLQDSLNQIAISHAAMAIGRLGKALPCRVTAVNGSIVTVAFEVTSSYTLPPITIPKAEGQWIRSPTQVGDLGLTQPSDVYLGGVSGLGGGSATMAQRANLSALVWVPVAGVAFPGVNINAAYVAGPEGAVVQTQNGVSVINVGTSGITITNTNGTIVLTAADTITLNAPTIELNGQITQGTGTLGSTATFIGPLNVTNDVTAGSISLETHVHGGVTTGGGDTGAPV